MIVGVDFDNTIVNYESVLADAADKRSLLKNKNLSSKRLIRDHIRSLPDGEIEWQKLQAYVYGPGMKDAQPFSGVLDFFQSCHQSSIKIYIISHKTEFARADTECRYPLRDHALMWLRQHKLIGGPFGVSQEGVFFESTRIKKIERMQSLQCDVFIDDLIETFNEPTFPNAVKKILFDPKLDEVIDTMPITFNQWSSIHDHIFGCVAVDSDS